MEKYFNMLTVPSFPSKINKFQFHNIRFIVLTDLDAVATSKLAQSKPSIVTVAQQKLLTKELKHPKEKKMKRYYW